MSLLACVILIFLLYPFLVTCVNYTSRVINMGVQLSVKSTVGFCICRVVHALHSLSKSLFCVLNISIKSHFIFDSRVYFVLQ